MKVSDYTSGFSGKYITEREILRLKKLLNGYSNSNMTKEEKAEIEQALYDRIDKGELFITKEQGEKGIAWLRNQWKTPRGVERKNNPFGYREEDVLENFSHFEFSGFYDASNSYQYQAGYRNLLPLYVAVGKEGSFEYYVQGGQIEIVG